MSKDYLDIENIATIRGATTSSGNTFEEIENSVIELIDELILRNNFRTLFQRHPEILTFGEDTGKIGGVNQGLEGLQDIFGESRVFDTGIREATIIGQGIGLSLRGLRPIAEIQYLDYLLYSIQILSDDLATLHYLSLIHI